MKGLAVCLFLVASLFLISSAHAQAKKPPFTLEKGKTALIVVDMQNEFVRDGGKLQCKAAKDTIGVNKKLIDFFHNGGMPVIYTRNVSRNDNMKVKIFNAGRPEMVSENVTVPGQKRYFTDIKKTLDVTDVIDELYPAKGDYVIDKDLYNLFAGTNADMLLKSLGIQYVLVTGTVTHVCVNATAEGAFDHGYYSTIVSDAVSSYAPEAFIKELLVQFARLYGRVMTSDQAIQELSR